MQLTELLLCVFILILFQFITAKPKIYSLKEAPLHLVEYMRCKKMYFIFDTFVITRIFNAILSLLLWRKA